MNTFTIIISMLFVGIISYIIGFRRAWKTYKTPSQEETEIYYKAGYDAGLRDAKREEKTKEFIASLEDAFEGEDEDTIVDCGEY